VRDVPAYLSASDWQTLSMSEGTKGPRLFDWTCLPIWHQGGDDGWHSLLLRRTLDPTPILSFYLVFAPPDTPLSAKVTALGGGFRIEEDFENGKDFGLDQDAGPQLRGLVSPYHRCRMLALAFLTSIPLSTGNPSTSVLPVESPPQEAVIPTDLCPLSVPEVRHLLARLLFPPPSSPPLVLAWSTWRRRHQHTARICHSRHRLKAG
jgi:hypothetical protein